MDQKRENMTTCNILIVAKDSREFLVEKEFLEKNGNNVHSASSEENAFKLSTSTIPIDLILIDIFYEKKFVTEITEDYTIPFVFMLSIKDQISKNEEFEGCGYYIVESSKTLLLHTIDLALKFHESQRNERSLIESEEKFRSLFYSAGDGAFILQDGKVIDCNTKAAKLLNGTREEIIGMHPWEFAPPFQPDGTPTKDKAMEWIKKVLDGNPIEFEFQHARLDGELIDTEMSLNIIDKEKNIFLGLMRDVTEKKKVRTALIESEERYRNFIDLSLEGICRLEFKTPMSISLPFEEQVQWSMEHLYIAECNDVFANMYGYENSQELEGKLNKELWQNENRAKEMVELWIKKNYIFENFETYEKNKEGENKYFLNNLISVILDDKVYHIWNTQIDVSEKKCYEIKLKEREKNLNEAQKISHIGHWVLDIKNDELTWSDEVYRIFGLKPQEFESTYESFLHHIHPEDRSYVNEAYISSLEEKTSYDIMHRLLLKDGSIKYVNERCETLYDNDGSPIQSMGTIQDITQRIESEKALQESEVRHRTLFESALDSIFIMDETKFIACNEATVIMFGCDDKNNILNHAPWEYSPEMQPDGMSSKEKAGFYIESALQGNSQNFYWKHKKKDGTLFDANVSLNLLSLDGQKLLQAIVRDITEQKEAEKEIHDKNIELLKRIEEKETLIREIFHRTRNTMLLIKSMLNLQGGCYSDDENIQELISITDQRIQAISLVHQMLYQAQDLSKISTKDYIEKLTSLIIQGYAHMIDRISVELQIDEQNFLIDTAVPLGLVLNELMTNSLKHGFPNDKGGSIIIKFSEEDSGDSLLNYSDNGIGVSKNFDFKNNNTLGLNLIYSLGEQQLKGTVTMENNNGITCIIKMPKTNYTERV